jgi:type IV pilus assembly protein PilC
LIQCLEILSNQSENAALRKSVGAIKVQVEGGSTFSDALRRHPKVFDDLYVNMVHAGEVGGLLDTILGRLSKYIEKAMKLKGQIKSAMVYPASIMGIAFIVIAVLMIFVIPVFEKMFKDMSGGKVGLPGPTQLVIDISNFAQSSWYIILGGVILAVVAFKKYYATAKGKYQIDKLLLKVPVFGDLVRKASVAKFTRTLGTLITSGVPLLDALTICAKTSGNKIVEEALINARVSISGGKTISEPLAKSQVFPKMVTHMISVGESTGALDAMLGKIADFYEDEVDQAVASLTALLEPMMMVFLGVLIGFIVVAMYLPIFTMANAISS